MSNNINTTSQGQITPFGFPQDASAVAGTEQKALERLYLSDIPQDTLAISEGKVTGTAQQAVPTQISIPVLNIPKAAPNAFKDVSDAPMPGSSNYDSMVMAFTPPGGNASDGADLYAAFLAEFPKGSPEYEAMMSVINFSLTDPTLGNKVKLFSEAREQLVAASPQKKANDANLEQLSNLSESDIETAINEGTKLFTLSGNLEGMDLNKAKLTSESIQESMINAQNLVNNLPASPEKDTLIGFLSKISAAIVLFTNMLYELQSSNMSQVNEKTRAQLDESLNKIEEQRKALIKQAKAEKKGKQKNAMGVVGKLIQAITVATLLVTASVLTCVPPFGTMVAAVLFMQATDTIMKMAGSKDAVWGNIGKAIDAVVGKICDAVGAPPALEKAMKIFAKVILAAVIMAAMIGSLAIIYGGGDAIKGALLDTGLIKNPIAQMVIGVVVELYVIGAQLVFAAGLMFAPGLEGFGVAIAASTVARFLGMATKLTMAAIMITSSIVSATVSIAQGAKQVQVGLTMMRLNKQLAKLEEDIALREAMVQLLKKAIKALQETLNSLVSTLSEVKESGTSLFKKLEYEMGKLHSV